MFGGNGSKRSTKIADDLYAAGVQSIIMCGNNRKLAATLKGMPGRHAVAFTEQVPDYMRLADFFVGKPGPGSMSEALLMGLPIIIENNAKTLIQERYNCIWAEEQGFGITLSDFKDIGRAAEYLLSENRLQQFSRNTERNNNQAVFEIPAILDVVMAGRSARAASALQSVSPYQTDLSFLGKRFAWTRAHLPYFKRPNSQPQATDTHYE
jgi:1,2-diacylglycerol 3-beta-galactosyltransferase